MYCTLTSFCVMSGCLATGSTSLSKQLHLHIHLHLALYHSYRQTSRFCLYKAEDVKVFQVGHVAGFTSSGLLKLVLLLKYLKKVANIFHQTLSLYHLA